MQSLALLLLFTASATAYPWRWLESHGRQACGTRPKQAYGVHQAPLKDGATTFLVTLEGNTAPLPPSAQLCPGNRYTVTASWNLVNRALMTTTAGQWATTPFPACVTSTFITDVGSTISDTVILPCTAKGKVTFEATHSDRYLNYLFNSVEYTISPACAAAACPKPASPPLAASPPPPPVTAAAKPPPAVKKSPPPKKTAPPPKKKASPPPKKKAAPPPKKKAAPPPKKKTPPPPPPTM